MEIVPGIHRVDGTRGSNVYLVVGEQLTLLDTGFRGNTSAVLAYMRRLGFDPSQLAWIVLTHRHPDHAGSAARLRELTGAEVVAHTLETSLSHGHRVVHAASPGVRGWVVNPVRRVMRVAPVTVDVLAADGMRLDGLVLLHTPGHTPGSLSAFDPARGALFTGDIVLNTGGRLRRPLPHSGAQREELEASLARLAALEPRVCCVAHGPCLTSDAAAKLRALAVCPPATPAWWRVARNPGAMGHFMARLLRRH